MSFSTKILLGLISGIAGGLFFGESVHHLEIFADGFVNLLRMTVLPYITVSLIFNPGRMDAAQARLLALRGGAILAALWALSILVSFLFPFASPGSINDVTVSGCDRRRSSSGSLLNVLRNFLVEMDIALWERNRDAFLIKSQLDLSRNFPEHVPVIRGLGPGPDNEINRGLSQVV